MPDQPRIYGVKPGQPAEGQDQGKRGKRRKNVIRASAHYAEYQRLIDGGWSSVALERYARYRYGEDIPARTWRAWRTRQGQVLEKNSLVRQIDVDPDVMLDVLATRRDMIELQAERVQIDARHEKNMSKLFTTTGNEVRLLGQLLDGYKTDLQDLGLFPKLGTSSSIDVNVTRGDDQQKRRAPRAQTLGDLFGQPGSEQLERQMARMLHDSLPVQLPSAEEA